MSNQLVKGSGCGVREWREAFTLTDTDGSTALFSVSLAGVMTATGTIANSDGTVALPSIAFSSDTDTGIYRIGANNLGVAVAGAKVLDVSATGLGVTGTTLSGNGTVSLPGIGFSSDTDSGIYRIGANNIGVAVNAAKVLDVATTGLTVTGALGTTGAVTFNDAAADVDFRVEGITEPNLLVCDASADQVQIGTLVTSSGERLSVWHALNRSINATAAGNVNIMCNVIAAADQGPTLTFAGNRDTAGASRRMFAGLKSGKLNSTNNDENAYLDFYTLGSGTLSARMRIDNTGSVNIGSGADAAVTAILSLISTTKGFLPPVMTTTQRDAISSPALGLVVMNSTTSKLNVKGASAWEAVTSV